MCHIMGAPQHPSENSVLVVTLKGQKALVVTLKGQKS